MADQEIPSLNPATSIDCDDLIHIIEDGNSRYARAGDMGMAYGTAFPVAGLEDGDRFYRTDEKIMWRYDLANTRWISDEQKELMLGWVNGAAADGSAWFAPIPHKGTYDLLLETFQVSTFLSVANTWLWRLDFRNTANASTTITSITTAGDASANWISKTAAINALLDANARVLEVFLDEQTGTTTLFGGAMLYYRLVHP